MPKSPKVTEQDQRRDEALKNALRMPPKPFTPKAAPKKGAKKRKS
jgi:hypothetical protein